MTQTISINLGGLLFHIDDEAFKILENYLDAIHRQFKNDTEKNDIIADIEARLAELLVERIDRKKDLVSVNDVNAIITIMGEPHNFVDDEEPQPKAKRVKQRGSKASRRMYRDTDNRILGGVCSGLGAYFSIDPWIFRTIFIVLSFFGFVGIIIYFILWITIPEAITTAQKLEMHGKPINIENIKRTVKQEFDNVKRRMNL